MFSHLKDQFSTELGELKQAGTYKNEYALAGKQGATVIIGGKQFLNFCSNNYLGLADSGVLAEAAKRALDEYGFGMASVRFICGTSVAHKELEAAVSAFFKQEDTILFSSCFDANGAVFEALLKEGDAVFSDELNHASIIDGIRLCKAERFRYAHANMAELEAKLKESGDRRRKLIVTDGVFSMDGDTAPLKEICELGEKYQALVMVDDSHGSGVLGKTGRGSIEAASVMDRIDLLTSTFGKALGGAGGGFVAGKKEIVEYLRQRGRPYLFSNNMVVAVAAAATDLLKNFDTQVASARQTLAQHTNYFREKMKALVFTLGGDGSHPITPVMLGDEKVAVAMADALLTKGIYVRGFTYPVVPLGKARIRVQLCASHTKEHLDRALDAFATVGRELKVIS